MSAKKTIKAKNMMYAQQMAHLPANTVDNLVNLIETRLKPKKYAVIVHDKDIDANGTPEPPNVHAMLSFDNARSLNRVANLLNDKPQYIEMWKGNANNGYSYLIHATKDAINKHQYDASEVMANFDYAAEIQNITQQVAKAHNHSEAKILLDLLYTGNISKEEVEKRLSGSQYGRIKKQIEDVWAKRLQNLAKEWRKEMIAQNKQVKVCWIYGLSDTGKSSLAKYYAKKTGQSVFFAGSSRDIFQNYSGEHTLVLDELRPHSIPYHDLLRIFDPFGIDTAVSLPARYRDKALVADMIIVTTPYDPYKFYKELFPGETVDKFEQLLRRITLTIIMTQKEILVAEYDDLKMEFLPIQSTSRPNTYSKINYPAATSNSAELFDAMFD